VVTEGDLLRRDELSTERGRPWWLKLLSPRRGRRRISPARTGAMCGT